MSAARVVAFLLAALALIVGVDNMQRPLANPDEGRYSEISREMAASGDWITPRLNGIKYFEKPPLQYWASAAAFSVLGESEFTARIYTALCGLLALIAVGFTGRRLAGADSALMAVGVLLSSPYFLGLGGVITLDMGLTAWTTVAVCAFLLAVTGPPGESRRWMLLAWAGMALAVLSKGLVGIVFPAAAIFLHCLLNRDWRLLAKLAWVPGIALFLAITAPWFVLVSLANPEFAQFFFVHEHFDRFLTKVHRREQPWWFFLPILFVGFLPWMLTLVPASLEGWRHEAGGATFRWRRFALLWSAFLMLFFSASGSKLPAYILPVFPILALVLGDWLARTPADRLWKPVLVLAPLLVVAIAAAWGAPERASSAWARELYAAARPWILTGLALLAVAMAAGAVLLRSGRKWTAIAIIVAASMLFIDFVEDGYHRLAPRQSGQEVAEVMKRHLGPATRIYSVGIYDQTIPFYLGRTVTLVDYWDEFSPGLKREPRLSLPTLEAFEVDWVRPGDALAIIHPDLHEKLTARGLAMTLLHRDERRVVVRKP
ncbi:MAG TPA: phospholipid carrier-dependent glycosyltransferase [Usitatibacteraceae bacterium]|nr:phospholipid carrier-dependent glycosyltransferase [Usitatibacteraceae bacterium]